MKVIAERFFDVPLTVSPDMTLQLIHCGVVVLEKTIDRWMEITKVVILEFEESDGLGGVGIGGAFIEEKE